MTVMATAATLDNGNGFSTRPRNTRLATVDGPGCLADSRDFEAWALPHREGLRRLARRLTGSATDAEDLVQDALLRGYTRRGQIDDRGSVGAWLAAILRNLFINERRREAARPRTVNMTVLGEGAEAVLATPATEGDATATEVVNRWEVEAILRAVDRLPDSLRQALLLCDVEGRSYEEIAEIARIPLGTVRSRLSRARSEVRRMLPSMYRQMAEAGRNRPPC